MPTPETELQQTERMLRQMLAEAQAAEAGGPGPGGRFARLRKLGVGRRARKPSPGESDEAPIVDEALTQLFSGPSAAIRSVPRPLPDLKRKKENRRGDIVMAALGVTLGLTCALFPWYIFLNQEQFGVQGIRFGGRGGNVGRSAAGSGPGSGMAPLAQQLPSRDLDPFATGALQDAPRQPDEAPGLDKQPFPSDAPAFRLVHIANGRAMIEDSAGLWVVQPGSTLPDSSRVRSIEQRKGKWVLVTSTDRVLETAK